MILSDMYPGYRLQLAIFQSFFLILGGIVVCERDVPTNRAFYIGFRVRDFVYLFAFVHLDYILPFLAFQKKVLCWRCLLTAVDS